MGRGTLRRYNRLWIASALGFGLLLVDSAAGLGTWRVSRLVVDLAAGDLSRTRLVLAVLGAVITLPVVFVSACLFALAAAHRIWAHSRRWILLGHGHLRRRPDGHGADGRATATGGARRARRTQATFGAQLYFRRLGPADQEATLALLDQAVTPPPATPLAAAPRNAAGSSAPPPPPPGRR